MNPRNHDFIVIFFLGVVVSSMACQSVISSGRDAAPTESPLPAQASSQAPTPSPDIGTFCSDQEDIHRTTDRFSFPSPLVGYSIVHPDEAVIRTEDGGLTWKVVSTVTGRINDVFFINPQIGWVAGDSGLILKTEDGGTHWQLLDSRAPIKLNVVQFIDEKTGWVGGINNVILHTTDGGATWSTSVIIQKHGFNVTDLSFLDRQNGYLSGSGGPFGYVMRTADGGATWENKFEVTVPNGIFATPDGVVWIAGGWVSYSIWKAEGDTAKEVFSHTPQVQSHLYDIYFSTSQHGWAFGTCGVYATQDGGMQWEKMDLRLESWAYFVTMRFFGSQEAVLVGPGGEETIYVLHSSDGGGSWTGSHSSICDIS